MELNKSVSVENPESDNADIVRIIDLIFLTFDVPSFAKLLAKLHVLEYSFRVV